MIRARSWALNPSMTACAPGRSRRTAKYSLRVSSAVVPKASFALVSSYGGYTTNLPLADLVDGQAWVAFDFDGEPLEAEHGGPARLLVPHLYFWKSAKWLQGIDLSDHDTPGFWESLGYHNYGDPWREQRYWGD